MLKRGNPVAGLLLAMGLSFPAFGAATWTTGTYSDSSYTQVANRLNGGTGSVVDGNASTYGEIYTGNTCTYTFTSAKDITDIRIYTTWPDTGRVGFKLSNIQVKYSADGDYEDLADTGIDYNSSSNPSTNRLYAALSNADGSIAEGVFGVQIVFEKCQNGFIGVSEVEVAGHDPIVPNPEWEITKVGTQAYISDGVWTFKATLGSTQVKNQDGTIRSDGPYGLSVGSCTAYPVAIAPLDFSKPLTNSTGDGKAYAITEINTVLGTWSGYTTGRKFTATAAGQVAGKLTLPTCDYQIILNEQAFCKCEHIDFDFAGLPAGLVRLGSNAFADADVHGNVDCAYLNYVGTHVFAKDSRLGSFKAPLVTTFDDSTFWQSGVTSIDLGTTGVLKSIGAYAFCNCTNLVSFTPFLPETCKIVNRGAFSGCTKLASPLVFYGRNNSTTLVNNSTDWEIFYNCCSIPSVDLSHSTLKFLTRNSFVNCYALKTVKLPDTLESLGCVAIGNQAGVFANCTNLTTVTPFIPDTVTNVATSTFSNCPKLRGTLKMQGVTDIGLNAVNNSGIDEVEFGMNLKRIYCAFYPCPNLTKITAPQKLKGVTLDGQAFRDCGSLSGSIDLRFVANINGGALFRGCGGVNELILGAGLTNVSSTAFYAMTGLRSIKWLGDKPAVIGATIFSGCGYQVITNYVPKAYADNWQSVVTDGGTLSKTPVQWTSGQTEWIRLLEYKIGFVMTMD